MQFSVSRRAAGLLLALSLALPFAAPGAALAHERRVVGPYTFVVGWIEEPALVGIHNGVDLRITRTSDGAPVENAHTGLKAAIAFGGGAPREFPLRARFGMPGAYVSDVIPTRAGSYLFTFTGAVEGTAVNERFESGPGRFNDVEPVERIQFPAPAPIPAPAPAPAAGTAGAPAAQPAAAEVVPSVDPAEVAQARAFGAAGAVLGLLGLATGAYALSAARRPRPAA